MDNNNLKYDDLTLMQFTDGELDEKTANQVEKDLIDNVELQQRLEVFTTTRNALLSMQNTDAKIPDQLSKMIDDYPEPKKDNKVLYFLKGNPLKSVAASAIVGMFLGTQGVQQLMVASNDPTLTPGITQKFMMASKERNSQLAEGDMINISRDNKLAPLVAHKLIQSLSKNASIKKTVLSSEDIDIDIVIISDFINSNNQQCRLAQAQESYFVACLGDDNKWVISN